MILKILCKDQSKTQEKQLSPPNKQKSSGDIVSSEPVKNEIIDDNQYYHQIKKGETIYGIAKKYNLDLEDLLKANPGVTSFESGKKLKIPGKNIEGTVQSSVSNTSKYPVRSTVNEQPVQIQNNIVANDAPVKYHKVKAKETLYGISKAYGVSIDDLMLMNPQVSNGVKKDMTLIIPSPVAERPVPKNTPKAVAEVAVPVVANEPPVKEKETQFKVALLVPFYLEEMDSLRLDQSDPKVFNFVQFYESALMAVELLKKEGLNVKLNVYDVDGDERIDKTRKVLTKREMATMDLIIGPFYAKGFEVASKYAGEHKIPIVNPLSKRNEILVGKPWVFKVQTGF